MYIKHMNKIMKSALVVGGSSGIGLAIVYNLLDKNYGKIYIVDRNEIVIDDVLSKYKEHFNKKVVFYQCNLVCDELKFLDKINDIDTLVITAGFGRVSLFENLNYAEVNNLIEVNFKSIVKIIKHYYYLINSDTDFYSLILVSIAGRIVSPFFSVYGAAKAGLRFFIENINCELTSTCKKNRILEVSPGSLKGTGFNGEKTDLESLETFAEEIVSKMYNREIIYIPQYDEIFKFVIERYHNNPIDFGKSSFEYKKKGGRVSSKPQLVVGYLSGTFDLFHIGHLNLLKRAKQQCDYLIVAVHESGSWKGKETFIPYEERRAIVESIKYVDKVVEDYKEDYDAWEVYHYNKLFVGSDYKGSERFNRYEKLLEGKAEIVYFPYTNGTSSTQLREALKKK